MLYHRRPTMGEFDHIIEQAQKIDEIALRRNIENQRQIIALHQSHTYGKSKFFQTKDELIGLANTMKATFEAPQFKMFEKIADVSDGTALTDDCDKLLFQLKQELNHLYECNDSYTKMRDGFDLYHLEETTKNEQRAFADTLSGIQTVDRIMDELMMYDISDSKDFDDLYVSFNNIKKRYSDVAEGSLNMIQDTYDKGLQVYKIQGGNPKTEVAFNEELARDQKAIDEGKQPRKNLKVEWVNESEPLFTHDPCPEDVMQGSVGDCYFIAALASIAAQNPDRIREMIKLKQVEQRDPEDPNKTVQSTVAVVRLYTLKNEPVDVTVPYSSCYLSGTDQKGEFSYPLYAGGATWVRMIEKALVVSGLHTKKAGSFELAVKGKYDPDYEEVSGGVSHKVMQILLGPEMAKKFDGKADVTEYELLLPSKEDYLQIEAKEKIDQERICRLAKADFDNSQKSLLGVRTHIKKDIGNALVFNENSNYEGRIDDIIEELLVNPQNAKTYFKDKGTSNRPDPIKYFERANAKVLSLEAKRNQAQKTLDKYDPVKSNRPKNFPAEYTKEELKKFEQLYSIFKSGLPLAASTPDYEHGDKMYKGIAYGIPFNHAYSITNLIEETNGVKYIEVRNPHNSATREYDADGNPLHNPDRSKMGVSRIELRDFCKTFDRIYFGNYEPKVTHAEKEANLKETTNLYGEALMSICKVIDKSDSMKTSRAYNNLRAASKTLMAKLKDKNVDYNDLREAIDDFFDMADTYKKHRDAETSARKLNKENAANRYIAVDAAMKIKNIMSANQMPGAVKQRADIYDIIRECMTVKETDSVSKKASVEVMKGIQNKAKAKQQKNLNKALEQAKKTSDIAKKLLDKGIREQEGQDIVTAISTMVYLDDVNAKSKEISTTALTDKYSSEGIKRGVDNLKKPVSEALKILLEEKGQEKLLAELAKGDSPVKLIRDTWKKQLKEHHPEAVNKGKNDHAVQMKM